MSKETLLSQGESTLLGFLKWWLEESVKDKPAADVDNWGLCDNLELHYSDVLEAGGIAHPRSFELVMKAVTVLAQKLKDEFGKEYQHREVAHWREYKGYEFPFNGGSRVDYVRESEKYMCHKNPRRIEWVKKTIAELEAENAG